MTSQPRMDADRFQQALLDADSVQSRYELVDQQVLRGVPHVFEHAPRGYQLMKRAVARALGIATADVAVVGSAQSGFSLDPNRFPAAFRKDSDVDVVVVSDKLFDVSWIDLLTNRRKGWWSLSARVRHHVTEHRREGYIYRGWIRPDSITPTLTIGMAWSTAFSRLPATTGLLEHPFHGRLYRTWEHVRIYHQLGLNTIRRSLLSSS